MPAPDILTFRLDRDNKKLCYVVPPQTLQDGLRVAKENFEELAHIAPNRITICVNAMVANQRQHIRISPASWPVVLSKLRAYEVLDVIVHSPSVPDIVVHSEDGIEKLPRYEDIPEKEKSGFDDYLAPSCPSSPRVKTLPIETIRAAQRAAGRTPSPSPSRTIHSKNSSSSSLSDIAKAIFGRGSSS